MPDRRLRIAHWVFLLAIGLAPSFGAAAARAGTLVEFPNVSERAPAKLRGYLWRPDAGLSGLLAKQSIHAEPYPAVVVLHACGGFSSHSARIADQIGSWGYVALTVDSLGSRGTTSRCGSMSLDQAFDAYAALRYLSQLDFVDPARVAVLGQSMAARRRSTPSIAIWPRNISTSASAPRSPITPIAASPRPR
jgi:hypothetical protein